MIYLDFFCFVLFRFCFRNRTIIAMLSLSTFRNEKQNEEICYSKDKQRKKNPSRCYTTNVTP